jgi:hypothetical protein
LRDQAGIIAVMGSIVECVALQTLPIPNALIVQMMEFTAAIMPPLKMLILSIYIAQEIYRLAGEP